MKWRSRSGHQLHLVRIQYGAARAELARGGAPPMRRIFARHAMPAEDLPAVFLFEQTEPSRLRPAKLQRGVNQLLQHPLGRIGHGLA